MKCLRLLVVAFATLVLSTSIAYAENNYFGIQAGMVFLEDSTLSVPGFFPVDLSTDSGFDIGVKLGRSYPNFRVEGELDYKTNDLDSLSDPTGTLPVDGDFTSTSFMLNAYYDIKATPTVTPYIGAGIGFSQVSLDGSVMGLQIVDDDDMVFSYQLLAGIGFSITPTITIDVGYKYYATTDPSFSDVDGYPFDAEYSTHNFVLGARFHF